MKFDEAVLKLNNPENIKRLIIELVDFDEDDDEQEQLLFLLSTLQKVSIDEVLESLRTQIVDKQKSNNLTNVNKEAKYVFD